MHIIGMRLKDNLEVEKYLRRHRTPSEMERDFPDFPYIHYTLNFDRFLEDQTPWHRHRALEIIEVLSGRLTARSSRSSYVMETGEICFFGTQVLRRLSPDPAGGSTVCELTLFYPELINGGWGNVFDSRYVSPVLDCRDMDIFYLSNQNEQTAGLKEYLRNAREICDRREYGYEFDVRREMSEAWKLLFLAARPRLNQRRTMNDRSEERMQSMMSFIQKHYAGEIGMAEIAAAGMVSERECFRCFQATLGITPIRFLQNYRIRLAARRLLESDDTIQSISEQTGFRDSSYFGRVFQKAMHCTPTEFRKRHHLIESMEETEEND